MGRRDAIDLRGEAHSRLFEVGAEEAVDQADRREVLNAGETHLLEFAEEQVADQEGIGSTDPGQHGGVLDRRQDLVAISLTIALALP